MVTSTADAETIYDDFDGTELDFSKWDITAQHGSALDSVANSVLTMTAPGGGFGTGGGFMILASPAANTFGDYSFKIGGNTLGTSVFGLEVGGGNDACRIVLRSGLIANVEGSFLFETYAGGTYPADATQTEVGFLETGDVVGFEWISGETSVYINGFKFATHTTDVPSVDMPYVLAVGDANFDAEVNIDYVASDGFTMHPDPTGDFDLNTFVDGEDFLLWQRGGSAVPLSPTELAVWEANYGSLVPLATSVTAVPEPSTLIILLFGMTTLLSHRRTVV